MNKATWAFFSSGDEGKAVTTNVTSVGDDESEVSGLLLKQRRSPTLPRALRSNFDVVEGEKGGRRPRVGAGAAGGLLCDPQMLALYETLTHLFCLSAMAVSLGVVDWGWWGRSDLYVGSLYRAVPCATAGIDFFCSSLECSLLQRSLNFVFVPREGQKCVGIVLL